MTTTTMELSRQLQLLPASERIALVESVLESLDACDPTLDELWAAEASSRLQGWKRGEFSSAPATDLFPELLA